MMCLLEEWALTGGTLTQLEEALLYLGKKDVIPGMLYMIMLTLTVIYQLIITTHSRHYLSCRLLLSDLQALHEKKSTVIETSEQISIKSNDKSGNLHTIHYSYI